MKPGLNHPQKNKDKRSVKRAPSAAWLLRELCTSTPCRDLSARLPVCSVSPYKRTDSDGAPDDPERVNTSPCMRARWPAC